MMQLQRVSLLFISTALLSFPMYACGTAKDAVVPYNWSGIYAGLNVGAVKHTMSITDNQATSFNSTIQQITNPRITGGFQLGLRQQLDPTKISGVYGVELSMNFSNAKYYQDYGSPFALYQLSSENALKNLGLVQLIGGIAADKTLVFLAAGLSWTNVTGTVTNQSGLPFFNSFSVSNKALGTALGGGIEYALNQQFSARFKIDVITPNAYPTFDNAGNNYQVSNSMIQGGLGVNYKFYS